MNEPGDWIFAACTIICAVHVRFSLTLYLHAATQFAWQELLLSGGPARRLIPRDIRRSTGNRTEKLYVAPLDFVRSMTLSLVQALNNPRAFVSFLHHRPPSASPEDASTAPLGREDIHVPASTHRWRILRCRLRLRL